MARFITLSNVESVVDGLSSSWIENEAWLLEFALKLNSKFKNLRDDLRKNKNTWSHLQYCDRLAHHYYEISSDFNDVFRKHKVDLQSVTRWMEKCLSVMKEVPRGQMTERLTSLSNDVDGYLLELGELEEQLTGKRNRCGTSSASSESDKYAELTTAVGDVTGNRQFAQFLSNCAERRRVRWQKTVQNIILVRALCFLEDSLSNPERKNSLSASKLSLSLGIVYSTIGITFLEERFKNTSENLLKSCLNSPRQGTDPREQITNLIGELVKGRHTLHQVKIAIEEVFDKQLSTIDQTYVERKYYSLCFDEFIKESVNFLKDLAEQKNRQVIMSLVPQMKSSESLLQIPHPLNQMECYALLKENYELARKDDEKQLMKIFKRECFLMIIEYVNLAKKELQFLERFIEFLGTFKDAQYLEAVLDLRHFCISDRPFEDLIRDILNLEKGEFGEQLEAVQSVAEPLKNETDLFYVDKFKEFVLAYLKPPEIRMVQLDGRGVLEVTGKQIVISEISSKDQFKDILANPSCEEVRFIGSNVIHVDDNFNKSVWHGKNVVVITKTLTVHGTVTWDVSGNDCTHTYTSGAGTLPEGNGKSGEDGIAGESGGNVLILVDNAVNPAKLTIVSDGGNGGKGQNGGNGRNGVDGKSISKHDFKEKFPPVAKFLVAHRFPLITRTLQTLLDYRSTIKLKWYERPVSNVSRYIPFATFYKKEIMSDSICQEKNFDNILADLTVPATDQHECYYGNLYIEATTSDGNDVVFSFERGAKSTNCQAFLLFKGSIGKPGCKGGEYGLGGQGGFGGEVVVRNPKDFSSKFNFEVSCKQGSNGANGEGGIHGDHGLNGWDIGYMDYSVSQFCTEKWPKTFGENENSKIKLYYYIADDKSRRIWCPYQRYMQRSEQYADMSGGIEENKKDKKYQERTNTSTNNELQAQSKATRKKTISQGNVFSHYQQHFNGVEQTSMNNLFDELENANAEVVQAIAENQKTQEEVTEQVQVSRCCLFNRHKNARHSDPPAPIEHKDQVENVDLVVSSLTIRPLPIDAWKELRKIQMTKSQLETLYSSFATVVGQIDSKLCAEIRTILLEKYRFAVLLEISKEFVGNEVDSLKIHTTTAIKYLNIVKVSPNELSHPILGSLNQYLFDVNQEERMKLSKFYKEELKITGNVLKAVISFVLEAGQRGNPSPKIKEWSEKYTFFLDKRSRGLVTFQESFVRLDRGFLNDINKSKKDDDWWEDEESILRQFLNNIETRGCKSISCVELLAYIFDVNIRVYTECQNQYPFVLKGDLNPNGKQFIHLLHRSEECIPLSVDLVFWNLERKRASDGEQFLKILDDTEQLKEKRELDDYLTSKSFNVKASDELEPPSRRSVISSAEVVNEIIGYFQNVEDQVLLGVRLYKLSPEYIGNTGILDGILKRFSSEGRHISAQELLCFLNSTLNSVAEGRNCADIYCWVVLAHPQSRWIDEVLLIDIETFFKRSLPETETWRKYMHQIGNKAILLILREKLQKIESNASLDTDCLEEVLHLLSKMSTSSVRLGELGIAEWCHALKEQYLTSKLSQLTNWKKDDLSTYSYYTLAIENMYGSILVDKLLESLLKRKGEIDFAIVSTILSSIYSEKWCLSDEELQELTASRRVKYWVDQMLKKFMVTDNERDINRLVELIKFNSHTSADVKKMLPFVEERINKISGNAFESSILKKKKVIHKFKESDIKDWVNVLTETREKFDDEDKKKDYLDGKCEEMLAVVDRAVQLRRHFRLRDTQRLSVLILLKNNRSTLAQVATGEGKSLIVVALSIIKALKGEKVDIITSSSVLAKRDAELNEDIYQLFGINVSHNCSDDMEKRKAAYSGSQVVYGDLSDFQRDYLLHEFYNINVLGDRRFESVVVDEVDSMLLDKGNNMLYLSHGIPGLDQLESVYLFIWQWINRPCSGRDDVLEMFDVKSIRNAVLNDLFGLIGKTDIKELDAKITDPQASAIWERLIDFNIIDSQARLVIDEVDRSKIERALSPNFKNYTDSLCYLINECLWRDRQINVPNYLIPFIELHMDTWITNAINAFFMRPGADYVVDVDRTGMSADRNPNITIIDKDTGTDQSNSQWEEALHQFLQLKHGCKLSTQTLKAVFISNVSYFKLYNNLYGLTGTLGSQGERKLLEYVHEAEFVTIPTAKAKRFREDSPYVSSGEESWSNTIRDVAQQMIRQKRSVLVICESVNEVEALRQCCEGNDAYTVHTYTREHEEFDITESKEKLGPGKLIIATNLAGRGTDIKIDDDLKSAGGLHVILSYLPNNARIEQQAFGRAARCGEKGSGQLIIKSSDTADAGGSKVVILKRERDFKELERISEIKVFYENQICVEEKCFSTFKKQYIALKELFTITTPEKVKNILLRSCIDKWAFWLDENGKLIKDHTSSKSGKALDESLDKFISQLKSLQTGTTDDWIRWVDKHPITLTKLGDYFLQSSQYETAKRLFDLAIALEPNFSEAAHYYKAGAMGNLIDWESLPGSDNVDVKSFRNELRLAAKLFERRGNQAIQNAAIVTQLKRSNKRSIVQIEAYEEQQKKIAGLYRLFSQSIDDIFGHPVTPQNFTNYDFNDVLADKLHRCLLHNGLLKHAEVSLKNILQAELETQLETLSCGYNVPLANLKAFLDRHDARLIRSFRDFKVAMKEDICLASKERFWKELTVKGILKNEKKFVVVDESKLTEIDPSLLDSFTGMSRVALAKRSFELEENHIFLNIEQHAEQKKMSSIFFKEDLIQLIGRDRYLALKRREVFQFNRKCSIDSEKLKSSAVVQENLAEGATKTQIQLSVYDSITIDDFTRNKVSLEDAQIIMKDLINQKVIEQMGTNTVKYRLAAHYTNIDKVRLTCRVYGHLTICLVKMSFSYRIALQRMAEQVESKSPVIFHLKTKPYLSLFWNLYDSKIIQPIKVCMGEEWKTLVEETFPTVVSESQLNQLLTDDFCVPQDKVDDLVKTLISSNWLIVHSYKNSKPSSFEIRKQDGSCKSLKGNYKIYEKTIEKIFKDHLKLSSEIAVVNISRTLDCMKSKLENLKVPSFSFKLLADACAEGDFSSAQEIYGFTLNGLNVLLTLEEKKYTWEMIVNTTIVIVMGICQIAIGAVIDMWSVGFMTHVGNAFISEGVSDIMFALGAVRSGYFSWKDYRSHKIESLMYTVLSVGVSSYWSRGTKFSRIGQEMTAPGVMIGGKKATEVAGAKVLKSVNASIGKQLIKQISLKTIEGVGYGMANMLVDSVVEKFLQSLTEGVASDIMADMEKEVNDHRISSKLRNVFDIMGEADGRAFISDTTENFFGRKSEWEQFATTANKIFSGVSRGIAEATNKNVSSGQTAGNLQKYLQTASKVVVWGERALHLREVRQMTGRLLDALAVEIDKNLSGRRRNTENAESKDSDFIRFKNDTVEDWKRRVREIGGRLISQEIVNPLLKEGAHKLVSFGGRKVKEFYRSCKEDRYAKLFEEYKQQYEESIENAGDDVATKNAITKEYHQNLVKLLSKTRSPKLFADIIKENVPMDMTCLEVCIRMLPSILARQGIDEKFKFIIEKEDSDMQQVIGSEEEGVNVIRLKIKDNHFELVQDGREAASGNRSEGDLIDNNCLFWALSERFDLGMSDVEFRHSVAKMIEEDSEMRSIVQSGFHQFGIYARMYGGDHPYERPNYYNFTAEIDEDFCKGKWKEQPDGTRVWAEDILTTEELNEQRTRAYNSALQKINEIVTGKSGIENWENSRLIEPYGQIRPEDFKRTEIFDTVRVTGSHGVVSKILYPVEIHTTIKVKVGSEIREYDVEINTDALIGDQKGPQGPHIGYKIKRLQKSGPKTVTGHYLINTTGNERLPRRQRNSGGGVYIVKDSGVPNNIVQIPPYRLFFGPRLMGSHLERDQGQSSRNRNYPSYYF